MSVAVRQNWSTYLPIWILIRNPRLMSKFCLHLFCDLYFLLKHFINHKPKTSLVNSSAMQFLLVDTISAVFDPFLSGFLSVIRKEFEVPPYSQSVELGSQIQLRCHPPKGVPTPRVSVLKWYVCLLILCHLELPEVASNTGCTKKIVDFNIHFKELWILLEERVGKSKSFSPIFFIYFFHFIFLKAYLHSRKFNKLTSK